MKQIEMAAQGREGKGTSEARRLRKQGLLPANLHGIKGKSAMALSLDAKEFYMATRSGAGSKMIFMLNVGDKQETAVVKEIQRDPLKGTVRHVDFMQISLKERIAVTVPVRLIGHAAGVKDGGTVEHILRSLEIEALPMVLPDHIDIDITDLKIGDAVYIKDLGLGSDVLVSRDDHDAVVMITHHALSEEAAADEASGEASLEPEVVSRGKEKEES